MVRKVASVLTTTLSIAVAVGAQALEGISLLQTQAYLHTQNDLPDPKKQSATSGQVDINLEEQDFQCKNGKGKWVYMNTNPVFGGNNRAKDLSESTVNIGEMQTSSDGQIRAMDYKTIVGPTGQKTYPKAGETEHGPVTDEINCFKRAKIDQRCNHYLEDLIYNDKNPKVLGVWYAGNGWGYPTCMCGDVEGRHIPEKPVEVSVGDTDASGMWFCQFLVSDRGDDNTPKELGAKEKKTKEEKEACAKNKAAAKSSRKAWKDLRAQLKAARAVVKGLKAQVKAAKEDLDAKKAELC